MNWNDFLRISPWLALSLFLGSVITYLLLKPKKINLSKIFEKDTFSAKVPTKKAVANLKIYRKNRAYASLSLHRKAKVQGVLHDITKFSDYLIKDFDEFKCTHTPKKGHIWEIGVYPMVCKVTFGKKDQPRVGVYFIPTMIPDTSSPNKVDPKKVMDFVTAWEGADHIYYVKDTFRKEYSTSSSKEREENEEGDEFVFDEGQLWP